ncbi:hypothetical protein SNEBB_009676 [Seison nebaliae]|nr:hypothetical protein SNEBB_009676 [Seison nebaliae]
MRTLFRFLFLHFIFRNIQPTEIKDMEDDVNYVSYYAPTESLDHLSLDIVAGLHEYEHIQIMSSINNMTDKDLDEPISPYFSDTKELKTDRFIRTAMMNFAITINVCLLETNEIYLNIRLREKSEVIKDVLMQKKCEQLRLKDGKLAKKIIIQVDPMPNKRNLKPYPPTPNAKTIALRIFEGEDPSRNETSNIEPNESNLLEEETYDDGYPSEINKEKTVKIHFDYNFQMRENISIDRINESLFHIMTSTFFASDIVILNIKRYIKKYQFWVSVNSEIRMHPIIQQSFLYFHGYNFSFEAKQRVDDLIAILNSKSTKDAFFSRIEFLLPCRMTEKSVTYISIRPILLPTTTSRPPASSGLTGDKETKSKLRTMGVIVGVVLGALLLLFIVGLFFYFRRRKQRKLMEELGIEDSDEKEPLIENKEKNRKGKLTRKLKNNDKRGNKKSDEQSFVYYYEFDDSNSNSKSKK